MNIDAQDSGHAEVVLPPTQAGERILNATEKKYIEAYADDPDETFDDATFSAGAQPTSPLRIQVYERRRVDEDEFVADLTRSLRALTGCDASVDALPLPDKIGLYHKLLKDFARSYVDGARRRWGDVPKGALGEGLSERRYFDPFTR